MQSQITKNSKYIYLISLCAIVWEIIDLLLTILFMNIYLNMIKYIINFTLILLFIVLVNKYCIILFLELIPILNLFPFFICFSIYSIIYERYRIHKKHKRPVVEYSKNSMLKSEGYFCPTCGTKINRNTNKCPNCGSKLEGENSSLQCPICRSAKIEEFIECPVCKTRFHRRCFLEWIKIKGICPNCKRPIDTSRI